MSPLPLHEQPWFGRTDDWSLWERQMFSAGTLVLTHALGTADRFTW